MSLTVNPHTISSHLTISMVNLYFDNFKLGIPEQHFQTVFSDAFWPNPIKRSVDSSTGIGRLLMGTFWICTIIIHRNQKTPNNRRLWCRFDYGKFLWSSSSFLCYLFATSTSVGFDIANCYHYTLIRRSQCTLKYWAPVTHKSITLSAGFFLSCSV